MDDSILQPVDRMVAASARTLTRRKMLRGAGATIATSVVAAGVWRPGMAWAECVGIAPRFSGNRVCGPSPYCNDWRCYSSGACHNTSNHKPRGYGGSSCISTGEGYGNCWCVCDSNNLYRCCDCCANTYQGGDTVYCSGCGGGNWYRCICRGTRCTSCC
jgi:hypothetical protein